MSKVRDLPQTTALADDDLLYAVDFSAGPNGGRKITKADLKTSVAPTAAETKAAYESNPDTNDFTDAEKAKLATVGTGAEFQDASQVPYNNSTSGLSATQVQAAIDEVNTKAQADFIPSIVSGRILHYSGGTARFDGIFFSILAGDILLNPNITLGEVYVDLDGLVKQTGSGILAPPFTLVFAKFSTDLNNITSLTDERVKNAQNLVRGLVSDIDGIEAGDTAYEGDSGRIADAQHRHAVSTGAASTQTPDQSNAEGVSTSFARADHTHDVPTASAIGLDSTSTSTQGSNATFARSNHTHAIASGTPSTQTPDQSNAAGSSTNFAKADHIHNVPTAAASSISTSTANARGSASTFARSDHTHAVSITNSTATATADDTTTSATDVLIVGMTLTPVAGTYLVSFSSSVLNSANGVSRLFVSIYSAGSQVTDSERNIGIAGAANVPVQTQAIVTVNGSQAIEARWRAVAGTNTAHQRSLAIIKLS